MKYTAVVRVDVEVEFDDDEMSDLGDQAMNAACDRIGASTWDYYMEVVEVNEVVG